MIKEINQPIESRESRKNKTIFFKLPDHITKTDSTFKIPTTLKKLLTTCSPVYNQNIDLPNTVIFEKNPMTFLDYEQQFRRVMEEIKNGNTYLLNLTCNTPIHTNLTLQEIYTHTSFQHDDYSLYYRDDVGAFTSFSPETFVQIHKSNIYAFPMKGTYQDLNQAMSAKDNPKEYYEQNTVVDRVRNDLALISDTVQVENFLIPQEVTTHNGKLYQTTSTVKGTLTKRFFDSPAQGLLTLLPAASITGAPKRKTTSIIKQAETHKRGYYTGIWGVVAENNLYSAVIIRYIEENKGEKHYKSGGGITFLSEATKEYQEMLDKIYLPFNSIPTSSTNMSHLNSANKSNTSNKEAKSTLYP